MFAHSTRTAAKATTAMVTIVVLVAIGGVVPSVFAQDSGQSGTAEQLLACDGMTDPTERLACINDLVEGLKRSPVAPSANSPSAPPPAPPSAPPSASVSPSPVSSTKAHTMTAVTPPVEVAPRPDKAANTSPPTGAPVAPTATPAAVVDDIGRDSEEPEVARQQIQEKMPDEETTQAIVVRSWQNSDYRFVVQLDNGEVWQQTDGYRVGLPKEGGSVEISKRRLGGHRMKIDKKSRLIGVRRMK